MKEIFPPLLVGAMFTIIGVAKIYGLTQGAVGGQDKGLSAKLCGT